ncbi:MAG: MarR family transcriptional regulator [Paenibacillaceae bacterium]
MYSYDFAKVWYKVTRDMKVHMDAQLAPTLTESQLNVLEFILNHDQVKPSDLTNFLATTPAAITTLMDRMEKSGLIVRERDTQDRRIVWLKLTSKGESEGRRGIKVRQDFLEEYLGRISSHNQQLLVYLLGKVSSF